MEINEALWTSDPIIPVKKPKREQIQHSLNQYPWLEYWLPRERKLILLGNHIVLLGQIRIWRDKEIFSQLISERAAAVNPRIAEQISDRAYYDTHLLLSVFLGLI